MRKFVLAVVVSCATLGVAWPALAERHMMSCEVEEGARSTAVVEPKGSLRPTNEAAIRITSAMGEPVFVGNWGAGAVRGSGAAFPMNAPQPVGQSCMATFEGPATGGDDEDSIRGATQAQLQAKIDQLQARVAKRQAQLDALRSQGAAPH
jgi:hypothetical protein